MKKEKSSAGKVLLLDIGNSNIKAAFAPYSGVKKESFRIGLLDFKKLVSFIKKNKDINSAIIVSVVPKVTVKVKQILRANIKKIKIYEVGKDIKIKMQSKYKNKSSLGKDRLLCSYYLKEKKYYPAVCVNAGSAITIDFISSRGLFLGGIIFPGIKLINTALAENTALIPLFKSRKLNMLYGKTTEECINIGAVQGISNLIDSVIKKFTESRKKIVYKIITGGDANLLLPMLKGKFLYMPNLELRAMGLLLAQKFKKMQK